MYLQYNGSMIDVDRFETALKRICDYKNLKYADSFRKAGMKDHYEIMGELLDYYKNFLRASVIKVETLEEVLSSSLKASCP